MLTKVREVEIKEVKEIVSLGEMFENGIELPVVASAVQPKTGTDWSWRLPDCFIIRELQEVGNDIYMNYSYQYHDGKLITTSGTLPKTKKMEIINTLESKALLLKLNREIKSNFIRHLMSFRTFTIGSDPEIFIEDGGRGLIQTPSFLGSKKNPLHKSSNAPIYWDGLFQAEFEVPAGTCLNEFSDYIRGSLKELLKAARRLNPKAKLSAKNLIKVPLKVLQTAKAEHVEFGCHPSFNAYGLRGRIGNGREVQYRSTGGHLHLGIGKLSMEQYVKIVKALDAIVGVCSVSLFEKMDSPIRREFYGLPGEFRTPPHGLEYRVLSNAWMTHPVLLHLVYDLARVVCDMGHSNMMNFWNATEDEVIDTIISCDANKAREIMERNEKVLMMIFKSIYGNLKTAKNAYKAFYNGTESFIKNTNDIEGNWRFETEWYTNDGACNQTWGTSQESINKGEKI